MNNQPIIPNVTAKIKELTATKQTYLKFIMQLFPFLKDLTKQVYANELIILLQNLINIHKNEILFELEDALTSILVTYIFDMSELIKGSLDFNKYEPRHKNLVAINHQVDFHVKCNDPYDLAELKATLFLV
jgi:hypothetical protein